MEDDDDLLRECDRAHRAFVRMRRGHGDTTEETARRRVASKFETLAARYPLLFDMACSAGYNPAYLREMLDMRSAVASGSSTYHDASVRIGEIFTKRFVKLP